ncbi:MAG: ATP-binding protein [Candidatus Polarisedimenticolaceae bacterium]|nr:ATP-binding protein [Candidatus Polarisedimenticolaceae bacterium]
MSPSRSLKALFWLRTFTILGQLAVVALVKIELAMELPLLPILTAIGALALWNLAAYWRQRQPWESTQLEIFMNLAVDITALTFLLYWTGGATNPFVSLYLIPIAIASAALSARYIWLTSLLCVAYYSFLMLFYTPLPPIHSDYGSDFNAHIFGMWINFILSAILMATIVAGISRSIHQRDKSLAKAREEALGSEKIVAMGTLAAGVAHEISTPLSTMTMITDELLHLPDPDQQLHPDLMLMRKQIEICKERIKELLDHAGHSRSEGGHAVPLRQFINRIIDQWQLMRPEVECGVHLNEPFQNPTILAEQTIAQSITNLLNNAADATLEEGSKRVIINISNVQQELVIQIDDEGPGISPEIASQMGKIPFSTKASGFGIGLALSNASLGRFGGGVTLTNRAGQGARTEVKLPLHELIIEENSSHE